jgi:hypothetical protein
MNHTNHERGWHHVEEQNHNGMDDASKSRTRLRNLRLGNSARLASYVMSELLAEDTILGRGHAHRLHCHDDICSHPSAEREKAKDVRDEINAADDMERQSDEREA